MITLKEHIDMTSYISNGGDIEKYIERMKPLKKLDFLREFTEVYPVDQHTKQPNDLNGVCLTIDSMVLGQFIMVEQIITGKTSLPDHIIDLEILKLICRPKHHKEFDNSSPEEEKENEARILSMDVRECYWILTKFIENRDKTLFNDFSGVFYEPKNEEEEDEETNTDQTSDMLFNQQWYWYSIVRTLSGEDIHKYEQTYMLPMSVVLPEMSYLAQRNKIEAAKQRQSQAMRRL